jgi:hypothetical protein
MPAPFGRGHKKAVEAFASKAKPLTTTFSTYSVWGNSTQIGVANHIRTYTPL